MIGGGMASIEREVTIPVPPEDVWPLMIDADQVSAWFGADVEIDPRPGGRATFRWADGTERAAMVEDVEPERRLAFRWLPFQSTTDGDIVIMPPARVVITLHPVTGGTRVRVVEELTVNRWPRVETRGAGSLLAAIEA
ncbi:MAG: hypothetical protein DMD81_15015 [Candidatus Rokuibacteriota bacterium]|nr:MAG: hypothetical protein DMD81_15015 [Candidatus Rokubacteria bacterium]